MTDQEKAVELAKKFNEPETTVREGVTILHEMRELVGKEEAHRLIKLYDTWEIGVGYKKA